jgi:plasmid stability protein
MRNVTITLEEDVVRWARIRAAERETSVARLVGELLREKMMAEETYQAAMNQYLSQAPRRLKKKGVPYPHREELHDRPGLR